MLQGYHKVDGGLNVIAPAPEAEPDGLAGTALFAMLPGGFQIRLKLGWVTWWLRYDGGKTPPSTQPPECSGNEVCHRRITYLPCRLAPACSRHERWRAGQVYAGLLNHRV